MSVAAFGVSLAAGAAIVLGAAAPVRAQSQARPNLAMDGQWHFVAAPYVWFAGINGDVSVKGLPAVPIDESFSDIFKNFHFGALAHFEGRKDHLGFATDVMYLDLHASVGTGVPVLSQLDLEATVKSLTSEGLGFYRVVTGGGKDDPAHLDVLVGVRYYRMSNQLSATIPIGGGIAGDKKEFGWVDALAGLRVRAPLGSRLAFIGRGDVAGLGSKFTWNLEGDVAGSLSEHWTLGLGWRHLSIDYDKGTGADRKLFDAAYDGPRTFVAYAW
jgi:hypothetical protein